MEAGGASWAVDIHILTPHTLAAHHQRVFVSAERGLSEAVVAVAPDLGAPGWASCWWRGAGGVEELDHIHLTFFFPFRVFFSPPKRKIMVFETLSGGHFGEDAIFLCHVMLFPHLISATLSQQSTVPPSAFPPRPPPTSFLAPLFQDLGLNG